MNIINPAEIARKFVAEAQTSVHELGRSLNVVGLIASNDAPSMAYANATKQAFKDVGFNYELRQVKRLDLETAILDANDDDQVHGIFIYFPVFKNQQDDYLRNLVDYTKDVEAGSLYWTRKLYSNDRLAVDGQPRKKALLPCTPLAIVKILASTPIYAEQHLAPLQNKIVTIFNRSEVIGRPLAMMMSNDGALVYSFDETGPLAFRRAVPHETDVQRKEALAQSDIVITGVPSNTFELIRPDEIKPESVCVNFSSFQNFDDGVAEHVQAFVPRVGPMTVAMCMRNAIRLYQNFHQPREN